MRIKIIPVLLFLNTLLYATMGYYNIHFFVDFFSVLTIPIIAWFYLSESTGKKLCYPYIISLCFLFVGDLFISLTDNMTFSLFFLGAGLTGYANTVLSKINFLKTSIIIKISIPFLLVYLVPSLYFASYFNEMLFPITMHNFGLGIFVFTILLKLLHEKKIRPNMYLVLSGTFMFLVAIFDAYVLFISHNDFIHSYISIPSFSIAHYCMSKFILKVYAKPK
ncbi:hypothetical protein [Neptunitalea lumnitzerae]|uniref:YhhN-like protein n=1 Tax=Neptunitalea lumnitzerae TaxID=2965509 RepID=A0ABQ5MLC3_9FLAO|nr:hypothetical protein [Neptunitalea sp. Y10]GLB49752.1 hypothetical protein Y10_21200 [Neptunitalea sp. Y10]